METNQITLTVEDIQDRQFFGSPMWSFMVATIVLSLLVLVFFVGYRHGYDRAADSTRVGSIGWQSHTWEQLYDRHMRKNHPREYGTE